MAGIISRLHHVVDCLRSITQINTLASHLGKVGSHHQAAAAVEGLRAGGYLGGGLRYGRHRRDQEHLVRFLVLDKLL